MKIKRITAVFVCVALLVMSGCAQSTNDRGQKSLVAASFYPVYIFTLNLTDGIDSIEVKCMAEQNVGCLHDYTLTAGDAKLLNDAELLVINGAGMESFIEDLSHTAEDIRVVDSSDGIEVLCDASHEAEHHNHEEHEHNHSHTDNAHIWMSVDNAKKQVFNIKCGLEKSFPDQADKINENYDAYIERLNILSGEISAQAKFLEGKKVVVFHNAYEYLAQDTGLQIVDTIESDEGGEPSAKELAKLSEQIKNEKISALFTEPEYEGSAATILSAETGVAVLTLNPVLKGESKKTAYEDIMRNNIEVLKAVK